MDSPSSSKMSVRKCKYAQRKCYLSANPSSDYCLNHDPASGGLMRCQFVCPDSQIKCHNVVVETEEKTRFCSSVCFSFLQRFTYILLQFLAQF